jgi:AcrR family transcriptional regulator
MLGNGAAAHRLHVDRAAYAAVIERPGRPVAPRGGLVLGVRHIEDPSFKLIRSIGTFSMVFPVNFMVVPLWVNDVGGITLRAVARRAGITAPSIYAHFDNLEDVIDAVVASTFEELARSLERDLSGYTDPRSAVTCPVPRLRVLRNRQTSALPAAVQPRPPTPQVTKSIDTMPGAEAFALLVRGIHASVDVGHSSSTDPERDAAVLWAALHGYVGLPATMPDFPWPPHGGVVDQFVDLLAPT